MQYEIIYSNRRTLAISIVEGRVVVRAPKGMSKYKIDFYVSKHKSWINKHVHRLSERDKLEELSCEDVACLRNSAREYFNEKTAHFAKIMGLKYGRITITSARKRFGSCSSKGNICFSYRLMLYPEEAREYVIVHELAHLLEFNHSKKFYGIIEKYMPDYKSRKKLLG